MNFITSFLIIYISTEIYCYISGVARLFCSRSKFKICGPHIKSYTHFKPKRYLFKVFSYKMVSKSSLQGPQKKCLAGRMRPLGRSLAMSAIYQRNTKAITVYVMKRTKYCKVWRRDDGGYGYSNAYFTSNVFLCVYWEIVNSTEWRNIFFSSVRNFGEDGPLATSGLNLTNSLSNDPKN